MEIKDFDRQFVERTKYIIEHPTYVEREYEITLLTNCLLALIVLPTERTSNKSKDAMFKSDVANEIKRMNVIQTSANDDRLFRTIKNAISHMHIEMKNKNGIISEILFCDKLSTAKEYHMELSINV